MFFLRPLLFWIAITAEIDFWAGLPSVFRHNSALPFPNTFVLVSWTTTCLQTVYGARLHPSVAHIVRHINSRTWLPPASMLLFFVNGMLFINVHEERSTLNETCAGWSGKTAFACKSVVQVLFAILAIVNAPTAVLMTVVFVIGLFASVPILAFLAVVELAYYISISAFLVVVCSIIYYELVKPFCPGFLRKRPCSSTVLRKLSQDAFETNKRLHLAQQNLSAFHNTHFEGSEVSVALAALEEPWIDLSQATDHYLSDYLYDCLAKSKSKGTWNGLQPEVLVPTFTNLFQLLNCQLDRRSSAFSGGALGAAHEAAGILPASLSSGPAVPFNSVLEEYLHAAQSAGISALSTAELFKRHLDWTVEHAEAVRAEDKAHEAVLDAVLLWKERKNELERKRFKQE